MYPGGMGSEAWNNVCNLYHELDRISIYINIIYIYILYYGSYPTKNICQSVVPCWGTAHFFEPQTVALEPIKSVGHGSWGLIHGQIDL